MAVTPELTQQGILPGIAVADAVEKYASLQAQLKELQKKLDEEKQTIIDFCQSEALNRVHGTEHEITYKLVEKTGFSEDEVRALLEPKGLWNRVLSLDQAQLKQFLADEEVAKDIRNKLKALRQVIATYPQLRVSKIKKEK